MDSTNAKLVLSNPLTPEVLPVEVEAHADSYAQHLCIPPFVRIQLALEPIGEREVIAADGQKKLVPYAGPVKLSFKNRIGFCGALVMGEDVHLGTIPMDDMDLVVISEDETVDVNPESSDVASSVVKSDDDEGEDLDEQFARIDAILGPNKGVSFEKSVEVFFEYLSRTLTLPCEVTGIEDFRWEEFYVIGPGKPGEYKRLRKTQPSYQDVYELLSIQLGIVSEWMLFAGEDIAAAVRRKSDKKKFTLGLAELKAVDEQSPNYQVLDDYSVFFVNSR